MKTKLELVAYLAENSNFTRTSADIVLSDVIDKLGDIKCAEVAKQALTNMAEATSLEYIASQLEPTVFKLKNPKNQEGALNWLAQAIREFGMK